MKILVKLVQHPFFIDEYHCLKVAEILGKFCEKVHQNKNGAALVLIASLFFTVNTYAEQVKIKSFQKESYQKILTQYKGQPLVLILWSVTCSSCLSEMALIQQVHQQYPKLNMLMLSVDGPEFHQEMMQIIQQQKLSTMEHWGFAEDNSPALRYAVDSRWYGELPRTYFFDREHHKTGISGVLSHKQYDETITQIMQLK